MEIKKILGENRFETFSKTRYAARAVIKGDGGILLVHDLENDVYMLPGGGLEKGETLEQCCIREVGEETGFQCRITGCPVQVEEYYEEYRYIDRYYLCEITGRGERRLTENEARLRLSAEWMPAAECVGLFARHNDFAAFEEKRGVYLREFTALSCCLNEKERVRSYAGQV